MNMSNKAYQKQPGLVSSKIGKCQRRLGLKGTPFSLGPCNKSEQG